MKQVKATAGQSSLLFFFDVFTNIASINKILLSAGNTQAPPTHLCSTKGARGVCPQANYNLEWKAGLALRDRERELTQ